MRGKPSIPTESKAYVERVFIFDSHPVQYKAPVYQELELLKPGSFKVIYATDCSVRGHRDRDFGQVVAWDTPLLSGYASLVLGNERGVPLHGFRSLTGRGIFSLLRQERPLAVLLSQFLYASDLATYLSCLALGIPIWIRHETQDEAFSRRPWKKTLRDLFYRYAYRRVKQAFYIGHLNYQHLLNHGVKPGSMSFAPYCVRSPTSGLSPSEKQQRRESVRTRLAVKADATLLLFSGKLIEKKHPQLIVEAMSLLSIHELERCKLLFVGSGNLEQPLREMAAPFGARVTFAGFTNQSAMPDYYLAADVLILPSRRAGETWGLVVNEALHAGCAVVMTDAVGCHAEFGSWERVRVIAEGDASACAMAIRDLSSFQRSFTWCMARMEHYSVRAAAAAIASEIDRLNGTKPAGAARPQDLDG